jgi:hypothetical protein
VYQSESGLSTRHLVNVSGISSGSPYSYEVESIGGDQIVKKEGSFSTNPDVYIISVQADKTSVPVTDWHYITFKVSTLENGQAQTNQNISVDTPDPSQNKISTGNFTYYPKEIGAHTLVFSWNGVSKSLDIQAVEYVKVDSAIQDVVNLNPNLESNTQDIGTFGLSEADEPVSIESVVYESDIIDRDYFYLQSGSLLFPICCGNKYVVDHKDPYMMFRIRVPNRKNYIGKHTITIKDIKLIGQNSGNYRFVAGLPVTFTFEVK